MITLDDLKLKPGVVSKTARAIRLKDELQKMLQLVVNVRSRLETELEDAVQAKFIDRTYVGKLKDLATMYERLTGSHIQLLKTEKTIEDAMTPAQEKQAVRDFVASLSLTEGGDLIEDLIARFRTAGGTRVFH